jgi:hypothetical protein
MDVLETVITIVFAAAIMALYQGLRGGFDYINQLRLEAKANLVTAPTWLQLLMVFASGCLVATIAYIWINQVWLVALAMTLGTLLISVSIKMLFLPRSESRFYQKLFGEI